VTPPSRWRVRSANARMAVQGASRASDSTNVGAWAVSSCSHVQKSWYRPEDGLSLRTIPECREHQSASKSAPDDKRGWGVLD